MTTTEQAKDRDHSGESCARVVSDSSSFSLLDFAPAGSYLEHDSTAPMPYAVWYPTDEAGDAESFDILGAGESAEAAIRDARATVDGWRRQAFRRLSEQRLIGGSMRRVREL